jgi:hypothetical protein
MSRRLPRIALIVLLAGSLGCLAAARPAYSRVFVGFGVPLSAGPPAYYPPPVFYPPAPYDPPPAYYPPPGHPAGLQTGFASPQGGQSCNAGGLMCPMERPVSAGSACYCRDRNGQRVWSRAT